MSESKLRAPIKDMLDASLDEARIQRMWRGTQREPTRSSPRWLVGAALVAVVVLLGIWRRGDAGPLAARDARALVFDRPSTLLSDGSQIALAAGTQLQLLENTGESFVLKLERGKARFAVTPGGPRRWRMECGLASVTVVGTELTIDRGAGTLRVEVVHGIVEVRSDRIPGGLRRLTMGQSLSIVGDDVRASVQARAAVSGMILPPSNLASEQQPVHMAAAQMLVQADRARQTGAQDRALSILYQLLREQPGTAEAGIAGFTLARMRMEHDPRAAAEALRASLAAATPDGLREDALARLVEAYARSGEPEHARITADEYRRSYPGGRRLVEVERWAAQP